jgi:hypothetical protein
MRFRPLLGSEYLDITRKSGNIVRGYRKERDIPRLMTQSRRRGVQISR